METTATLAASFAFGLVTAKFYEMWDFYTEQLGFRTLEQTDDLVVLVHGSGVRLEIMRHETNEQHAELVSATDGRGIWLNLDVVDVDAEYERLRAVGVPMVRPLAVGLRRARFFVVGDPSGVLIRISAAMTSLVAEAEELVEVEDSG